MSFPLLTQLDHVEEIKEAKQYSQDQLALHKRVDPCLTLYRASDKVMSIYFPESVDRQSQFQETSFLVSVLGIDSIRLIMDSVMPKSIFSESALNNETIDSILCVFGTTDGAYALPFPYILHPENELPIWQDDKFDVSALDFLKSNSTLIDFITSQFFVSRHVFPWKYYLDYLKDNGYTLEYHHPFTELNIGYGLMPIY
jgi:hypothetical protein